jgi:hypothetical protein
LWIALFDDLFALPMAESLFLKAAPLSRLLSGFLLTAVLVVYLDFLLMAVLVVLPDVYLVASLMAVLLASRWLVNLSTRYCLHIPFSTPSAVQWDV